MNHFEYRRPTTLAEAFRARELEPDSRFVAGGSDVFLLLKKEIIAPDRLISLRAIDELKGIKQADNRVFIGSGTTIRELEKSELVGEKFPALQDAAINLASPQIRNVATLGGNIVNASPGADTAAPLLVYNAAVNIVNANLSERVVPLTDFFRGPKSVHLETDEIVKGFTLEIPPVNSGSIYLKFMKRKAMDLANVGVGVMLTFADDGSCADIRIGLATVAPTPIRALKTETFLKGKVLDETTLTQAGEIAASEISPIDDLRGQAWHKIEVVKTYIKRACQKAKERAET
jgi:CO/xanthine dehydrogenase FAD-binding subunit